jgi:alpha-glucosidase
LEALDALAVRGWPCNTLGNHDRPRIRSAYSDGAHEAELARLNAALVLTLRGTPFLYNGEEIGMTDLIITEPEKLRDTMAVWYHQQMVEELGVAPDEAARRAGEMTRDKNRTPLQWENAPNGGFCPAGVTPWLPVNPNYAEGVNAAEQEDDPDSFLNFYRRLLAVRQAAPALVAGEYQPLDEGAENYFAFLRTVEEQTVLVVLNYAAEEVALSFDLRKVLFATQGSEAANGKVQVGAFGVVVGEVG